MRSSDRPALRDTRIGAGPIGGGTPAGLAAGDGYATTGSLPTAATPAKGWLNCQRAATGPSTFAKPMVDRALWRRLRAFMAASIAH